MAVWKRHVGVLGMVLVLIGMCSIGLALAQVDVTFPWTQPGSYTGNAIGFGGVPVGQTKTATYTFKILETSETSATVTITRPHPPFGSDAPIYPFTLAPGQSITFNVTFTPPSVGGYTGNFTITAQGGRPVVTKKQTVILTGQGIAGIEYQPPSEKAPGGPAILYPEEVVTPTPGESARLEAKLDTAGRTLDELRQKLDNLGWWLGRLTVGWPIGIEPHSTNPIPETNIWELLAKIEAKLDRMTQQPSEATAPDMNITIIEIYNIIVEINHLIINLGGNVAGIETKLDRMAQQPTEAAAPDINITIVEIYNIIVEINQLIINLGGNVAGIETKLDQLSTDLFDLWLDLMSMWDDLDDMWDGMIDRFDDVEDAIAANTRAINALQASNARIEDKLNQLLGLPAMATMTLITLTVSPAFISAPDHTATLEGLPGAVEGGTMINVYWSGIDNWRPGVTDPFWFDSITANTNGSFSLSKSGWGNSWPVWCEVTQTNAKGESAPVRVYNSTVMIAM